MNNSPQRVFEAMLRQNYLPFLQKAFSTASGGETMLTNWHLEAISYQLDRIRDGSNTRLIVTMPPRNLKSITISVVWVAWMLGLNPSLRFVCVSYSSELSKKHARDCRAIMQTEWYCRVFPNTRLKRGVSAEMDFETTDGGGRLSTSVGGTLTGRGGDYVIIDDPIKPDEAMSEVARKNALEWYSNTLVSRLNDKNKGAIILVMQRLHEEDLAGHLLEAGGWHHLTLPAIAEEDHTIQLRPKKFHQYCAGSALHPEREDIAVLERLKREMGTAKFSAQYQQCPIPAKGLFVQRAWFRYYDQLPDMQTGHIVVQSWDTASKDGVNNDWSVCITAQICGREVYVLDVYREKLKFPSLVRKVSALAKYWNPNALLIEDAASGQQLIQVLREQPSNHVPRPIARKPTSDKVTRFHGQSHRIEARELLLPKRTAWLETFEYEILGFPNSKFDDQVDALAQLLEWRRLPGQRLHNIKRTPDTVGGFVVSASGREY